MKKKLLLTIITLLICVPVFAGTVIYKLIPVNYPVYVDGTPLLSDLPVMTYKTGKGDNTYVPLRAVLDMMGAKTIWNGSVNIITSQADPAKVADSVVEIYVRKNGKDIGQGSGIIYEWDRIITNYHVADEGDSYRIVYNDGTITQAKLIKYKTNEDIAVLEPERKDVKPVKIGDSDEVKVGDKVFCISSPEENKNVVTQGKVVMLYDCKGITTIATSASLKEGSSGGALFNKNGELIGIMKAGILNNQTQNTDSLSIPINDVRKALAN